MKEKELKDYEYSELIDYLTGQAIMSLGRGQSLKTIVGYNVHMTTSWMIERKKGEKKK